MTNLGLSVPPHPNLMVELPKSITKVGESKGVGEMVVDMVEC
jgi:hypothetical protein